MLIGGLTAKADNPSSASYSMTIETIDGGGGLASATSYTCQASLGGAGGVSGVVSPQIDLKPGFTGQLYEVQALQLEAVPLMIPEGGLITLSATATLDDASILPLSSDEVIWEVVSGPLTTINVNGVATAGVVFAETPAVAGGSRSGISAQIALSVLDFDPDNFGEYAGDGLDDGWQVEHFGLPPNALAGPEEDPDADGDDNKAEHTFGFDPNDSDDQFRFVILGLSGSRASFELNKVIPGRTYKLKAGNDLATFAEEVSTFSVTEEEFNYQIDDLNAVGTKKFYLLEVTNP